MAGKEILFSGFFYLMRMASLALKFMKILKFPALFAPCLTPDGKRGYGQLLFQEGFNLDPEFIILHLQ